MKKAAIFTKILYITSVSLEKEKHTGNKIHFIEVGKALKNLGNEVILVAPYYRETGTRASYGLIDEQIELNKKNFFTLMLFHYKLKNKLNKLIQTYKPDFVYSRDLYNARSISKILKTNKLKHFIEVNDIVKDHVFSPKIAKSFFVKAQDEQIKSADLIRVITPQTRLKIENLYPEKKNAIAVIRHGTDPEIFKNRGKEGSRNLLKLNKKDFIFCFVGTYNYMTYINGLKFFLKSYKDFIENTCSETTLLLVGKGKYQQILEEYANDLGISNHIIFTGAIPNQDVPDYLSASDICLQVWLPEDKNKEGLSLKISSYLSCERRVIASDIPSFRRLLTPFETIFWKLESNESMLDCIKHSYYEKNSWTRGKQQRKYVLENFTWKIAAENIIKFFLEGD